MIKCKTTKSIGLAIWGTKGRYRILGLSNIVTNDIPSDDQALHKACASSICKKWLVPFEFNNSKLDYFDIHSLPLATAYTIYQSVYDGHGRIGFYAISVLLNHSVRIEGDPILELLLSISRLFEQNYIIKNDRSQNIINPDIEVNMHDFMALTDHYNIQTNGARNSNIYKNTTAFIIENSQQFAYVAEHQYLYGGSEIIYLTPNKTDSLSGTEEGVNRMVREIKKSRATKQINILLKDKRTGARLDGKVILDIEHNHQEIRVLNDQTTASIVVMDDLSPIKYLATSNNSGYDITEDTTYLKDIKYNTLTIELEEKPFLICDIRIPNQQQLTRHDIEVKLDDQVLEETNFSNIKIHLNIGEPARMIQVSSKKVKISPLTRHVSYEDDREYITTKERNAKKLELDLELIPILNIEIQDAKGKKIIDEKIDLRVSGSTLNNNKIDLSDYDQSDTIIISAKSETYGTIKDGTRKVADLLGLTKSNQPLQLRMSDSKEIYPLKIKFQDNNNKPLEGVHCIIYLDNSEFKRVTSNEKGEVESRVNFKDGSKRPSKDNISITYQKEGFEKSKSQEKISSNNTVRLNKLQNSYVINFAHPEEINDIQIGVTHPKLRREKKVRINNGSIHVQFPSDYTPNDIDEILLTVKKNHKGIQEGIQKHINIQKLFAQKVNPVSLRNNFGIASLFKSRLIRSGILFIGLTSLIFVGYRQGWIDIFQNDETTKSTTNPVGNTEDEEGTKPIDPKDLQEQKKYIEKQLENHRFTTNLEEFNSSIKKVKEKDEEWLHDKNRSSQIENYQMACDLVTKTEGDKRLNEEEIKQLEKLKDSNDFNDEQKQYLQKLYESSKKIESALPTESITKDETKNPAEPSGDQCESKNVQSLITQLKEEIELTSFDDVKHKIENPMAELEEACPNNEWLASNLMKINNYNIVARAHWSGHYLIDSNESLKNTVSIKDVQSKIDELDKCIVNYSNTLNNKQKNELNLLRDKLARLGIEKWDNNFLEQQ